MPDNKHSRLEVAKVILDEVKKAVDKGNNDHTVKAALDIASDLLTREMEELNNFMKRLEAAAVNSNESD